MRIVYIDDSFFQPTSFSQTMLARLKQQLRQLHPQAVLVSTVNVNDVQERLCAEDSPAFAVIADPCRFHCGEVSGVLRADALFIAGEGIHRCYSGSLLCYDSTRRQAWRVYLDLFVDRKADALARLSRQIEAFLSDVLSEKKHIVH